MNKQTQATCTVLSRYLAIALELGDEHAIYLFEQAIQRYICKSYRTRISRGAWLEPRHTYEVVLGYLKTWDRKRGHPWSAETRREPSMQKQAASVEA